MNTLKILAIASTAFVAVAAVPCANAAGETRVDGQHLALAQEFLAKAAVANEKAAAHQVMARTGGSPKANRQAMASHCEGLIAQYRAEAAEYAAKATEYQRLAGGEAVTLTPEQHLAAARDLDAKAASANEKAAAHAVMARSGGSPKASGPAMSNHCNRLIAQYRADADAYAATAADHRRLATAK